jgi:hypothetical protein
MRNVIRTLGILALAVAGITAHARASDFVQATVPFAFRASGQALPAGDYRFSLNHSGDLVTISGHNLSTTMLLTTPGDQLHNDRSFLRFERYGDEWLLHQISFAGMEQQVGSSRNLKK